MRVTVDENRCIGTGNCVLVAPEVFTQRDEDGIAQPLMARPPAELHGVAREAAEECPALAISTGEDA